MTQALAKALREAWGDGNDSSEPVSWRTMLLRVREVVNSEFPQQNPHAEGPDTHLLFSLETIVTGALVLRLEEGVAIIQAGRVSGVRKDNVYALMPFGAERPNEKTRIGTATVTHVAGLKARVELLLFPGKGFIPPEGVLAFLVKEALHRWPAAYPEELDVLQNAINESKYLQCRDAIRDSSSLVEFRQDGHNLILFTSQGVKLASRQVSDSDPSSWKNASNDLVKQAEQLARAQHLKALPCHSQDEKLKHDLAVTFGTVKQGESDRIVKQDGSDSIAEGDSVYILLENNGSGKVYTSVFDINVAGQISLISKGSASGIDLAPGRTYVLGARPFDGGLRGLPISWPQGVPRTQPVNEHLVVLLTDSPVDLRYLADTATARSQGHARPSSLERLAFHLATGAQRDMASDSCTEFVRYDTIHIPFAVNPLATEDTSTAPASLPAQDEGRELQAGELPLPEEAVQWPPPPQQSPYLQQAARVSGNAASVYPENPTNRDHHM
jgi:hypothetical protein